MWFCKSWRNILLQTRVHACDTRQKQKKRKSSDTTKNKDNDVDGDEFNLLCCFKDLSRHFLGFWGPKFACILLIYFNFAIDNWHRCCSVTRRCEKKQKGKVYDDIWCGWWWNATLLILNAVALWTTIFCISRYILRVKNQIFEWQYETAGAGPTSSFNIKQHHFWYFIWQPKNKRNSWNFIYFPNHRKLRRHNPANEIKLFGLFLAFFSQI